MRLLAEDQIKHIEERLSEASLTNDSLSIDILDHLCCMIEERMDLGCEFVKAETEVFNQLGISQIQAIEQETKMLTQNTLLMKKRTKIIGLVALVLMTTGFIMKQLHVLGAGVTWIAGVLTAVFGFALFLLLDRFKYDTSSQEKAISFVGFLGAASFILGTGFKLLRQPGAHSMIWIGAVVLLFYYIINSAVKTREKLS